MSQKQIVVEVKDRVGVVSIHRPEVYNALNRECWRGIREAASALEADSAVGVIIFTGSGEKAFAAGADIGALRERTVTQTLAGENSGVTLAIEQCVKPTIAAVNGLALGGGCELAMACDIRIAAENARFGQTELNVGILPGAGGTQRLTQLVGIGKAMEMVLTGDVISAGEALQIGLVNRVVPAGSLMDEAFAMAEKILSKSEITRRLAKLAIREGAKTNLSTAMLLEILCQSIVFGDEDHMEGLSAFLEKRKPEYRGK